MKHTPQIALAAARRELDNAREACPHWDYEGTGAESTYTECCYRVDDAKRAVRKAVKAVQS